MVLKELTEMIGEFPIKFSELKAELPTEDFKPVCVLAAGGGSLFSSALLIPGSSKYIHSIYTPYAYEAAKQFGAGDEKAVSIERVTKQYEFLKKTYGDDLNYIVVSGALVSDYDRKGEDHAYLLANDSIYHLEFDLSYRDQPLTEDIRIGLRIAQDAVIAGSMLILLGGLVADELDESMELFIQSIAAENDNFVKFTKVQ